MKDLFPIDGVTPVEIASADVNHFPNPLDSGFARLLLGGQKPEPRTYYFTGGLVAARDHAPLDKRGLLGSDGNRFARTRAHNRFDLSSARLYDNVAQSKKLPMVFGAQRGLERMAFDGERQPRMV
jgi:hypothetical protein